MSAQSGLDRLVWVYKQKNNKPSSNWLQQLAKAYQRVQKEEQHLSQLQQLITQAAAHTKVAQLYSAQWLQLGPVFRQQLEHVIAVQQKVLDKVNIDFNSAQQYWQKYYQQHQLLSGLLVKRRLKNKLKALKREQEE